MFLGKMFKGFFMGVSRVFKVIPVSLRVSRGCFKEVSRVFQVYLYGVSRLFKNVARVF